MAKRKVDGILNDTLPQPSKEAYNKAWNEFMKFVRKENTRPHEEDYLQYFDNLNNEKKLKASTIWTTYSKLNAIHQREFGERLQTYPWITQLLKSHNSAYEQKVASAFDKKEVEQYLNLLDNSPHVLVPKAIIVIALSGENG